jgi:hypothetical protein
VIIASSKNSICDIREGYEQSNLCMPGYIDLGCCYLDSLRDESRIVLLVYLYVVHFVQAEYVVSCRVPDSSAETL